LLVAALANVASAYLVCGTAFVSQPRSTDRLLLEVRAFSPNKTELNYSSALEEDCWKEALIDPKVSHDRLSSGEKIRTGESVFLLSDFTSEEECAELASACSKAAGSHRKLVVKPGSGSPDLVRLPTLSAAARAVKRNTPCAKALPEDLDKECNRLLLKISARVDQQMESIGRSLFSGCSLHRLYLEDALGFASREPAVNVYTSGGHFLPHEDGHSLTVLVPLSRPDHDFTGGGTAFWPQDSRGPRVVPPTLVLRPKAGTAMLFGGSVTHSGVAVETGERVVLVASFSPGRISGTQPG